MMTSSTHTVCEEVASDLPRIVLKTPARTSAHASRQAERPPPSPTIDSMLLEARGHRERCERLLEALGAPVASCATITSSKES